MSGQHSSANRGADMQRQLANVERALVGMAQLLQIPSVDDGSAGYDDQCLSLMAWLLRRIIASTAYLQRCAACCA